ncbi:MAG TPA: copper amine oxidase N-terminal domain-containing protein [Syntrophomonadaceae bacterium]|nr:copper amine oxidase N-terminal domain-containing protein [Syntrophomonadaceae bacterium]
MKFRKIIAGLVSVTFLSLSFLAPVVANQETKVADRVIMPIEKSDFLSATGVIKEVKDYHADENAKFISIIDGNGNPANLIVNKNTYVVDEVELVVGSQIIFFYDASRPMIMIYPPQYNPDVVALIDDSRIIKVDTFDRDLVSRDNSLKLNISPETEIYLRDGSIYDGEIAGQQLLVIYDISTKSIPAQTNPKRVVVLNDITGENEDLYDENYKPNVSKMNIVVDNDMVIMEPKAYTHADGAVMIPLRVVAEALGYEVGWDGKNYSITLDNRISLQIDSPNYTKSNISITLDTAPALVDNTTYVPLNFFTSVLLLNNAYVFEGQIDINDGEKME